jgi:predicted N-acyltransferase
MAGHDKIMFGTPRAEGCMFLRDRNEICFTIERRLNVLDARNSGGHKLERGDLPFSQQDDGLPRRQFDQSVHHVLVARVGAGRRNEVH